MTKIKTTHIYLIIFFLIISTGCAVRKLPDCKKDGISYGKANVIFLDEWHDYYKRGLSFMHGGCYNLALSDFQESVKIRFEDKAFARTYGMHFMHYFPHREMGYIYYILDDEINATNELELSLKQHFSDKAQYYLDKVRSLVIKKRSRLSIGPEIIVHPPFDMDNIRINASPVIISATIYDPNYVSEIMFAGEPVFLTSSSPKIEFQKELQIDPGEHEIRIVAKNLAGIETTKSFVLHIDRSGPIIMIEKIDWEKGIISGYLDDETENIQLWINSENTFHYKGRHIPFSIYFQKNEKNIKLHAKDSLGNQTIAFIGAEKKLYSNALLASTQETPLYFAFDLSPQKQYQNQKPKPEIILYGWNEYNTVFINKVLINGLFKGNKTIHQLIMNEKIITKDCKETTFFNESIDLKKGNNKVIIRAVDQAGQTSCISTINIFRKTPEPYKIKHRIGLRLPAIDLDINDIPATIHCDIEKNSFPDPVIQLSCVKIKDFRKFFINQLKDTGRFQLSGNSQKILLTKYSEFVLYINIFETKKDFEVFIRFVQTETEHTFNIFDAYAEKNCQDVVKKLATKLIEKIKGTYPLSEGQIVKAHENQIEIGVKNDPFLINWPIVIFRKQSTQYNPMTGDELGADALVIGHATTSALIHGGCKAIVDERLETIDMKDHVVQK